MQRPSIALIVTTLAAALAPSADAGLILKTKDMFVANQPPPPPPPPPRPRPNDVHYIYAGNQVATFTAFYSTFPNARVPVVSYDRARNETILTFAGDTPPPNFNGFITNGAAMKNQGQRNGPVTKLKPRQKRAVRTFNGVPIGQLPSPDDEYRLDRTTRVATVSISNDSEETFTLLFVGYLVSSTPIDLTNLNRQDNPPSTFTPVSRLAGLELLPHTSVMFSLPSAVLLTDYVTVFTDSRFSGSSVTQDYQDESGDWTEFQAVPEPLSLALACSGGLILLGRRLLHGRRRGRPEPREAA